MAAIATQTIDQPRNEQSESASAPVDLYGFDEQFDDIAEIVNENFILEVEASRSVSE